MMKYELGIISSFKSWAMHGSYIYCDSLMHTDRSEKVEDKR